MENFEKLYQKTLHFLSFRPRSEKELKDYLVKKKASSLVAVKIIQNLKQNKFIDDKEFTKWWIEQRTKIKPRADWIIRFELKQKGIEKEVVDEFIGNSEISEFDKALDLAQRKIKRYEKFDRNKKYEKMVRFLASKGFNYDLIKEVLASLKLLAKRD